MDRPRRRGQVMKGFEDRLGGKDGRQGLLKPGRPTPGESGHDERVAWIDLRGDLTIQVVRRRRLAGLQPLSRTRAGHYRGVSAFICGRSLAVRVFSVVIMIGRKVLAVDPVRLVERILLLNLFRQVSGVIPDGQRLSRHVLRTLYWVREPMVGERRDIADEHAIPDGQVGGALLEVLVP